MKNRFSGSASFHIRHLTCTNKNSFISATFQVYFILHPNLGAKLKALRDVWRFVVWVSFFLSFLRALRFAIYFRYTFSTDITWSWNWWNEMKSFKIVQDTDEDILWEEELHNLQWIFVFTARCDAGSALWCQENRLLFNSLPNALWLLIKLREFHVFFLDWLLKWWDHVLVIASSNTQTCALKNHLFAKRKWGSQQKIFLRKFYLKFKFFSSRVN